MSTSPLINSWTEYAEAAERMLALATQSIAIFDSDLSALRLERPATSASLMRLLRASPSSTVRISVRNAAPLRTNHPHLLEMLRIFAHKFEVRETPSHLAHLADSMLLIDDSSALIRFHADHPRSKEITADTDQCQAYRKRFEDIWAEGGTALSATVTGL